jgi:outer membrane protein assembly factor BamB
MKPFTVRLTAALAALIVTACGSTIANLYFSPSTEQIQAQAKKIKPPLWKIPLGPSSIQEMQFLAPGRLFVGLKRIDSVMSNRECMLVDTDRGSVLWRFNREEQGDYNTVLAVENMILFRRDHGSDTKLTALNSADGSVLWTISARTPSPVVLSFPEERLIVIVEREDRRVRFSAHELKSGKSVWSRDREASLPKQMPLPLVLPEAFVHFYDGTEMVSVKTGKTVWRNADVKSGPQSPPAQLSNGELFLVDGSPALQVLNAGSGQKLLAERLEQGISFTNISLSREMIYLRGTGAGRDTKKYQIIALKRSDGKAAWTYADSDSSVSNIIEENDRAYFGTATSLVALDSTGKQLFKATASTTGRTYPVQVRAMRDKILFISEVIIAAFDPISGKKHYSHGVTPIQDLDGLDILIKSRQEELAQSKGQQSGFTWSQFYGQESARYQNVASSSYQESSRLFSEGKYGESDMAFGRASAARNSSKAYSLMAFQSAVTELGNSIAEGLKQAQLQGSINMFKFLHGAILSAYQAAEHGEYVYRPHTKGTDFTGVAVIHMPTGTYRYFNLSPAYQDYGIWNLIDFRKGIIYHHGLGMGGDYTFAEPFTAYTGMIKHRKYNSFLIAQPIEIPK